jgi:hypothetical protein
MNDPSTGDAPLRCDAALRAAIELRLGAFARQSYTKPICPGCRTLRPGAIAPR